MKTRDIVVVVLVIHLVACGAALQGCRSTGGESMAPHTDIANPPAEIVQTTEVPVVETPVTEVEPVIPKIETTSYVIRKGDTLGAIAKHYGVRVGDIMALNGLENANKLRVGQKIELPGIHDVSSKPPVAHSTPKHKKSESTEKVAAASSTDGAYVIKKGDSLAKIAKAHGVSVKALKEANNMTSDKITAGKKLTIPGSTQVAEPTPSAPTGADAGMTAPGGMSAPGMTIPAPTSDLTNSTLPKPDAIDTTELEGEGSPAAAAPQPADSTATTPAPAVDAAPAAAVSAPMATSDYKTHTVSAGEDLSTIAIQWGVTEDSIRSLNGLTSDTLKEGQVLKIVPAH